MLIDIAHRIITELGPWLWMLAGFALMAVEIISGRGIALSLGLGAMMAGILAIFGAGGIWPPTSNLVHSLVFIVSGLAILTALKMRKLSV